MKTSGAATLVKSAASAAIVEAVDTHPHGNGSLPTRDHNKFVRGVTTLTHVRAFSFFHRRCFIDSPWFDSTDGSLVYGSGFGRGIVRVLDVSSHPCVLITGGPDSALRSLILSRPFCRTLCVVRRYQSVSVYFYAMYWHLHRHRLIFDAEFLQVGVRALRTAGVNE